MKDNTRTQLITLGLIRPSPVKPTKPHDNQQAIALRRRECRTVQELPAILRKQAW